MIHPLAFFAVSISVAFYDDPSETNPRSVPEALTAAVEFVDEPIGNTTKPEAIISGSSGGVPGDILILDGRDSKNAVSYGWTSIPLEVDGKPTLQVIEGGARAIVRSAPGSYIVILAVGGGGDQVDVAQWPVEVALQPRPEPNPVVPTPRPDPFVPTPPLSPLANLARQLASKVLEESQNKAGSLAASYVLAASAASGGEWPTVEKAKIGAALLNATALGGLDDNPHIDAWGPWFDGMQSSFDGLTTIDQHVEAWEELAKGLDAFDRERKARGK